MRSLSLNGRITAIVITVLLGIWLGTITSFYLSQDWEQQGFWPAADRVASIVNVLEITPPDARQPVLMALNSQTLRLRVDNRNMPMEEDSSPRQADEEITKTYAQKLPGRSVTAATYRKRKPFPFSSLWGATPLQVLEIRTGLKTGETLVITSVTPLPITAFGLPTGVGAGIVGTFIALCALSILLLELRPLRQLARAVDQIGLDGHMVELPNVRRQSTEIRSLVTAFDRLQTRLSQLLAGRMALFGGISHDLRTFATRLRLRIDFIENEAQRERASNDITDMIKLLDDALLATRLSAGDLSEELLDVEEVVQAEIEDLQSHGAQLSFKKAAQASNAMVLGDRLALRRIVTNIVGNAIKYGQCAQVGLQVTAHEVLLKVEDQGPGIPPEHLSIITEPFVRGEASRSRDTGGSGLGLAVVRNLVEAHRGRIDISNRQTGGLCVVVSLPRYRV